jgi:hypothetical protein
LHELDPRFIRAYLPDLFESEAAYFESDAECSAFDGGCIARMPGLESLAVTR